MNINMSKINLDNPKIDKFLEESNAIENVHGEEALQEAKEAFGFASRKEIIEPHIRVIHKKLLDERQPNIAGEYRDCAVRIAGNRKEDIGSDKLKKIMEKWCKKWQEQKELYNVLDTDKNAAKFCKHMHVGFEKVHPFRDGNGRVGRILYNIQRKRLGLDIHVIKAENRQKYYDWFD